MNHGCGHFVLVAGPGPGSSKLGFRTTAAIIFARLTLVPPAGLGIVTLADKLGFLPPDDKMFRFILLIQHTMPTSVLSGIPYTSFLVLIRRDISEHFLGVKT